MFLNLNDAEPREGLTAMAKVADVIERHFNGTWQGSLPSGFLQVVAPDRSFPREKRTFESWAASD
jgi:hypothetical protein